MLGSLALLSSCGEEPPELDSVKERFVFLIEESRELNNIYFGHGLPVYRAEDELAERRAVYSSDNISGYSKVTEDTELFSVDRIKEATEKIYSEEYRNAIYETAFDGVVTGMAGAYLRFYEYNGILYQNISAPDFGLSERIYDYSTMKINEGSREDYVHIEVKSYSLEDMTPRTIYLSFVYENNDWYLDAPTY